MSRDAGGRAQDASRRDTALSKQYGANSDSLYGQLVPMYTAQATNPQGLTQGERNDATTSAMQATGGAVAGATGEGERKAAATGNAGGYQAALADAARKGIAANSDTALKVANTDTAVKEAQRGMGEAGLQGLQSSQQGATLNAMGLNNGAINAETSASPGWFQNMTSLIEAIAKAGSAGAAAAHGGGSNG